MDRTDEMRAAGIPGPPDELRLGDRVIRVEPFSGRKALRALKLLRGVTDEIPKIIEEWGAFVRAYEDGNSITVSRSTALAQFPPLYAIDPDTGQRLATSDGDLVMLRAGRYEHLTEADWEASDHQVTLPRSPSMGEQIAAIFPMAFDLAETEVKRLLALIAMPESEVRERRGDLDDALDTAAEEILDAPFDDLVELMVLGGEALDEQYRRKAAKLGDRLGNMARLIGLKIKMPDEPLPQEETGISSTGKPPSFTSSGEPTDGAPTSPSEPIGVSSSASTTEST